MPFNIKLNPYYILTIVIIASGSIPKGSFSCSIAHAHHTNDKPSQAMMREASPVLPASSRSSWILA